MSYVRQQICQNSPTDLKDIRVHVFMGKAACLAASTESLSPSSTSVLCAFLCLCLMSYLRPFTASAV